MIWATSNGVGAYLLLAGQWLHSAATTMGGPGLLLIALADSSFLSVPEGNDLLIVVLSTGQSWGRMSYFVLMTVLGSVAGCTLLYWVGRRGGRFVERRPRRQKLKKIKASFQRWGLWTVMIPSILPPPTPFKVFVLSAGVFKVPFKRFLIAVAVGRSIRYFMWGILALLYGEAAKRFLEENIRAVGLAIALFLVLSGLVFLWLKMKKGDAEADELAG